MKKTTIILIGTVAIIIALVLGYVAFVKPKSGEPVQAPKVNNNTADTMPTPDNASIPIPAPNDNSEIDTADWLTYRNEEFGFEVKYPGEWELIYLKDFNPGNTGIVLQSPKYQPIKDGSITHVGEIYINNIDNQDNLSIKNLFSTFSDSSVSWFDKFNYTEIVVNENNGILFDYIMENSSSLDPQNNIKRISAYILGDKKVIEISYLFLENPNRKVFDEILYSFNFVK